MRHARNVQHDVHGHDVVDLRPVEGPSADEDLSLLARALGHPSRVRIVRSLRLGDGSSVGKLVEELGLAQSTVSEHLRVLREAGLVTSGQDVDGKRLFLDVHRIRRLKALVGSL
jgi:ArsR family transcriptional regulator